MVQLLLGQHTRPRQKLVQPIRQIHCFLPRQLFCCNCLAEQLTFLPQCLIGEREKDFLSYKWERGTSAAWYLESRVWHTQKTPCDHQPVTNNCTRRAKRYLRTKYQSVPTSTGCLWELSKLHSWKCHFLRNLCSCTYLSLRFPIKKLLLGLISNA